ncbi:unnamed protein product [Dibothriocephalus latus]|uniref:ubiquitinyl hydrolase 1 n=1 Tax=Dibothriocephalus latus TaxID=60516 RepID=A0A3P6TJP8_DIBLA|nr:unnamed protein product [Dibothriocephalus latus]
MSSISDIAQAPTAPIYHQKQSLLLCAVHAINNVLQFEAVNKKSMDAICSSLSPGSSWTNPHRNILGLGNFDVNVLILALQENGHDVVWFNRQKSMTEYNLNWDLITGFILNTGRKWLSPIPLTSHHWIAFRGFPSPGGDRFQYYDLDSKLPSPLLVASSHAEFATYIENRLNGSSSSQLLIVAPKEVVSDRTWTLTKAS